MKQTKITLEVCSYPDHVDVPEYIKDGAALSQECMASIRSAQEIISNNTDIRSICLRYEPDLFKGILDDIERDINIYVSYLAVYEKEIYWYIQDKWDCFNQIEYIINIKENS